MSQRGSNRHHQRGSTGAPMSRQQCHFQELVLDINADVAEFCTDPTHYDLLAVGTYELEEATRERHGRLHLYSLASSSLNGQPCLQLAATLDVPGIFDLQWTQLPHIHDVPCIGLALADGSVQLLAVAGAATAAAAPAEVESSASSTCHNVVTPNEANLRHDGASKHGENVAQLQKLCSCQAVSEGMALSLDWNTQQQTTTMLAASSSSSGAVSVLQVWFCHIWHLYRWPWQQAPTAA